MKLSRFPKQQGSMSLGMMYLIFSLGFFLMCAFKIGPAYLDNSFVEAALKSMGSDPAIAEMSNRDFRKKLSKKFSMNNIRGEVTEAVQVKKTPKGTLITIDYENRIPIVANLEVVLTFKNHWNSNTPTVCCKPASE
jgi:hypothetical protein